MARRLRPDSAPETGAKVVTQSPEHINTYAVVRKYLLSDPFQRRSRNGGY